MRYNSLVITLLIIISVFYGSCAQNRTSGVQQKQAPKLVQPTTVKIEKVVKTNEEWKEQLTELQYQVTREKGTERAFTGAYYDQKTDGNYNCIGCQLPLFSSDTKYKSGTGWPSFWKPIKNEHIIEEADNKYGWKRVEVLCGRCDAHLGHVFEDGPPPTNDID